MINQLAFLEKYPKGIYKTSLYANMNSGEIDILHKEEIEKHLSYISKYKELVLTPDEFFQRWLNGRLDKKPNLPHYVDCKGFELQIPQIRINKRDDGSVAFGCIEGLVIASDLGYSDFRDTLVFVLNDIFSKKILIYKEENIENLDNSNLKKELIPKLNFLSCGYPFSSVNPLKSAGYTWTLINILSEEVYESLRKIGFSW